MSRVVCLTTYRARSLYLRTRSLLREYRALLARYRAAVDSQPTTHTKA